MKINILHEAKRGCGYRNPAKNGPGLYLMGVGEFGTCDRLPFPLSVCPCCGAGIKPSRGFTWIDPQQLFDPELEPRCEPLTDISEDLHDHDRCPICNPLDFLNQGGLMWVGEQHYPTPHHFVREAKIQGISKKIAAMPNGFDFDRHFVYLAHRKAVMDCEDHDAPAKPGVFMVFRPTHLDIVIDNKAEEIPEKAANLVKKWGEEFTNVVKIAKIEPKQPPLEFG